MSNGSGAWDPTGSMVTVPSETPLKREYQLEKASWFWVMESHVPFHLPVPGSHGLNLWRPPCMLPQPVYIPMGVSSVVSEKHASLLALTVFLSPLQYGSLSLEGRSLTKTSQLGLSVPKSLTLCTVWDNFYGPPWNVSTACAASVTSYIPA